MAACCGKSKADMGADESDAADERPQDDLVSDLSLQRVHEVLQQMSGQKVRKAGALAAPTGEGDSGSDVDKGAIRQSGAVSETMQLTAKLWGGRKRMCGQMATPAEGTTYRFAKEDRKRGKRAS